MINLALTIIDFGLVILAWLVQVIIYPSFQHIEVVKLHDWHQKYQVLISYFVLPLMLAELALSAFITYGEFSLLNISHLFLLIIIWLSTFLQAVPVHKKIAEEVDLANNIPRLVRVNLGRTLAWTACFLLSLMMLAENFPLS